MDEQRKCNRAKKNYFQGEFYSKCMEEGARVLKWNPCITALVIGIIVWLLQRGPLHYGTFKGLIPMISSGLILTAGTRSKIIEIILKKPSFLVSLFAILTLISVNFADFITGLMTATHKTISETQTMISQQCGHSPAVLSVNITKNRSFTLKISLFKLIISRCWSPTVGARIII